MSENPVPDPIRAQGPALVTAGPPGARRLIVLDPAGEAKHDGLPPTWRPLTEDHHVVWCRMPAEGALREATEAVTNRAEHRVDLVASGPFAGEALRLAAERPDHVRSVLLVDPAAEGVLSPGDATEADETWLAEHGTVVAQLRDAGVDVDLLAHTTDDDRVPAPVPLGHPRVAEALCSALANLPALHRPAL
ncbi:hypothetical protein VSH64_14330 [Amycolatopsis rhabdoformis]|uniref:Alpha/beta hydrolase n=1 Tax=Amycolatopsis rhabdoformis TaxID=1448059 RepID=A0ABZ1IHU1_9PSEU|nr:hypothetical protein [Amycolatopsis rhabdoformis]WSE33278.1 hypothetical protein VSH64_14330 [Amycolatopsis rhabdoformis]